RVPPVAAVPAHLFGRDEFRSAPADVLVFRLGQRPVLRTVHIDEPQLATGQVGDAPAARIRSGVCHRLAGRQFAGGARGDVDDEQPAGQGECRDPPIAVGGVGGDPGGALAGAFAASLFLRGDLVV